MPWVYKINKPSPINLIALFLRLTKFVNNMKTTDVHIWNSINVSNILTTFKMYLQNYDPN